MSTVVDEGGSGMLQVAFRRVRPEMVGVLREWMAELNDRRDEVLETFEAVTTRHEKATGGY